jgi:hypothetical protein
LQSLLGWRWDDNSSIHFHPGQCCSGVIEACFSYVGTLPEAKDALHISANISQILESFLSNLTGMGSSGELLDDENLLMTL